MWYRELNANLFLYYVVWGAGILTCYYTMWYGERNANLLLYYVVWGAGILTCYYIDPVDVHPRRNLGTSY